LNRFEHAPAGAATRYHKIGHDSQAIESLFVDMFLEAHATPPGQMISRQPSPLALPSRI
jgi:hypothetical protein